MIVPQNYAKLRQETNLSSVSLVYIRVHLFKIECIYCNAERR